MNIQYPTRNTQYPSIEFIHKWIHVIKN